MGVVSNSWNNLAEDSSTQDSSSCHALILIHFTAVLCGTTLTELAVDACAFRLKEKLVVVQRHQTDHALATVACSLVKVTSLDP